MIKGLYTSASSMLHRFGKQEVAANNLANINTTGYKRDGFFQRALVEAGQSLSGSYHPEWRSKDPVEVIVDFSQGPLKQTDGALDVAIQGDGFFTIQTPDGERYTRNGSFKLDRDGVLTTQTGYPVLGEGGTIMLQGADVKINEKGALLVDGLLVDALDIRDFERPYRMMKVAGEFFLPKDGDQGQPSENMAVYQGFLEESNVNSTMEMTDMLIVYRNYESDQRAVQMQDETLRKAVNELGAVR